MAEMLVDGDTMRKAGTKQFRLEGWVATAPFEDLLEITVEEAGEGRAVLSLPFKVKFAQGGGLLHGGALVTLADTAVAMAIKTRLPEGTAFATTEIKSRFLAPVREGRVTAVAAVTGPEGRTFHGQAVIADEEGREVFQFRSVFRVARGQGFED
ncbi:MAG: PaaI family thioesterase [Desulfuromonadales bacterium]|jgi:acyl-CoA thioesterase